MCGYNTNIHHSETYGISPDDPIVQNEKAKFRTGVVSGTSALGSTIHHIKKGTKEFSDVISWKKFD